MILQLGTYQFSGLKSPSSFSHTSESKYETVNNIGTKPSVQNNGDELDTINFEITLDASFCNPQTEIDTLNASRLNKEVMRLIDGTGKNYGKFVIKSIAKNIVKTFADGKIWNCILSIELMEYNAITDSTTSAPAISVNNPVTQTPIAPLPESSFDVDAKMKAGKIQINSIPSSSEITNDQSTFNKIKKSASTAKMFYDQASAKMIAYTAVYYRAQSAYTQMQTVITYLSDIKTACSANNLNDVISSVNNCKNAELSLENEYSHVVGMMACREGGML